MSEPELWRRCPDDDGGNPHDLSVHCATCGGSPFTDWGTDGHRLARVPVGALLIEDPEAAVERVAALVNFTDYNGNRDAEACSAFGREALRAAVGEEP